MNDARHILADKLKFTKPEELEEWLKDKPIEWAQVIAARAALRVLPLVGRVYQSKEIGRNEQNILISMTFRACLISLASRKYPAEDMIAIAYAAFRATASTTLATKAISGDISPTAFLAASTASVLSVASAPDAVAASRAASATKASSVAATAARASDDANIWVAISQDANWLTTQEGDAAEQAKKLSQTRLWPKGQPDWVSNERKNLESALINSSNHHKFWVNWYNNVLGGKPYFRNQKGRRLFTEISPAREKALTLKIAQQPTDFWEQDFAKVSEDISGWLEEARIEDAAEAAQQQLDEEGVEQGNLSIPPQKPATVQPIWVEGRLIQSTAPMHAEIEDELLAAFAQGLRNEIANLAHDVLQTNFDKSGLKLLAETADLMPEFKPDAVLMFQLVFREAQLSDQIDMIKGQWSDALAIRYCALLRQLSVYLDRFTEKRQFNRDKLETDLEDVDLEELDQEVSIFGNYLRSDDVSVIVDESIPDALESIGVSTLDDNADDLHPTHVGRSTQIVKAADQIESVNNVSRELIDLVGVENAPDMFETGNKSYKQGIIDNYVEASYEAGRDDAKKLAKTINRGSVGLAAGRSIMNSLGDKFPKIFGWMNRNED